MFQTAQVIGPERSATCRKLTALLPDWFGLPESNARYIEGVADLTCFGAFTDERVCVGMAATRVHFATTLEIWWMGVDPVFHRRGVGSALVAAAAEHADKIGCNTIVLMTLSEESGDPGYAGTHRFYLAQGFRPFIHDHMVDPETPLLWMIRSLNGSIAMA
jgi:GNAT superfamily N-acetyltransferase